MKVEVTHLANDMLQVMVDGKRVAYHVLNNNARIKWLSRANVGFSLELEEKVAIMNETKRQVAVLVALADRAWSTVAQVLDTTPSQARKTIGLGTFGRYFAKQLGELKNERRDDGGDDDTALDDSDGTVRGGEEDPVEDSQG